ncbi:MAG TPA: universal stress protein [Jatrophihabitans sp.]|nr:universal stress protein [Jatrophihabitans sp.]
MTERRTAADEIDQVAGNRGMVRPAPFPHHTSTVTAGRRIVLGISGHQTTHLIGWTTVLVQPGDTVHIVHGYSPIPYAATDWQLPVDNDNLVRGATERHVRAAAARLRRYRPDIEVLDELTGDPAATALAEAARGADLVLVGTPHCDRSQTVLARLLAKVDCPVMVLGTAPPATGQQVLALLRGSQADDAVLQAAYAEAERLRCRLRVLKPWLAPLDGNVCYAETAERRMLDGYLARWLERRPEVQVTPELRFGDPLQVLTEHATVDQPLVVGLPRPTTDHAYFDAMNSSVISVRERPTIVVPEPELTYRSLVTAGWLPDAAR